MTTATVAVPRPRLSEQFCERFKGKLLQPLRGLPLWAGSPRQLRRFCRSRRIHFVGELLTALDDFAASPGVSAATKKSVIAGLEDYDSAFSGASTLPEHTRDWLRRNNPSLCFAKYPATGFFHNLFQALSAPVQCLRLPEWTDGGGRRVAAKLVKHGCTRVWQIVTREDFIEMCRLVDPIVSGHRRAFASPQQLDLPILTDSELSVLESALESFDRRLVLGMKLRKSVIRRLERLGDFVEDVSTV